MRKTLLFALIGGCLILTTACEGDTTIIRDDDSAVEDAAEDAADAVGDAADDAADAIGDAADEIDDAVR